MTRSYSDVFPRRGSSVIAGLVAVFISIPLTATLLTICRALGDSLGGMAEELPPGMILVWCMALGLPMNAPGAFAIGYASGAWTRSRVLNRKPIHRSLVGVGCAACGTVYGLLLALLVLLSDGGFPWVFLPVGAVAGTIIGLTAVAVVMKDARDAPA